MMAEEAGASISDEEYKAWFRREIGRSHTSKRELAVFAVIKHTDRNPQLSAFRRELVIAAERLGDPYLTYAKTRYPYYWGELRMEITSEEAARALDITTEEGARLDSSILEQMGPTDEGGDADA